MNIDLPLDNGFLRRQCPNCNGEFKWHHGPVGGTPEQTEQIDGYFCPLCGQAGAKDAFWTHEQLDYIRDSAGAYTRRMFQDAIADTFRGSKNVRYTPGFRANDPVGLFEPDDMMEVQPPCHPWEPIKIPEDWIVPIHCLVCGEPFRV